MPGRPRHPRTPSACPQLRGQGSFDVGCTTLASMPGRSQPPGAPMWPLRSRSTRIPANTEPSNAPQGGRAVAMRKPLPLMSGMARTMAALPCASRSRSRTSPHEWGALPHAYSEKSKRGVGIALHRAGGGSPDGKGEEIPLYPFLTADKSASCDFQYWKIVEICKNQY